jgi:hypothetical protein
MVEEIVGKRAVEVYRFIAMQRESAVVQLVPWFVMCNA